MIGGDPGRGAGHVPARLRGAVRRLGRGAARLGRGARRLGGGARRLPPLGLLALVLVPVTGVAAYRASHRPVVVDPGVGDVVRVGVADGDSVPGYLAASRNRLARLVATPPSAPTGGVYALVSLDGYRDPDQLVPVLDGFEVVRVYARVPLPDTQTEIVALPVQRVPQDVVGGMDAEATRKDAEASDERSRAGTATDPQHRAVFSANADVAAAEAAAYRRHCACVYAAVVRASPGGLARLADRPGVRAVDPAPQVTRLDHAVFRAPLPEQTSTVEPPPDRGYRAGPGG
ncbi:MAG TPA: hypothetical protein VF054_00940 [Micromonosporaceae bacterium]